MIWDGKSNVGSLNEQFSFKKKYQNGIFLTKVKSKLPVPAAGETALFPFLYQYHSLIPKGNCLRNCTASDDDLTIFNL